MTTPPFIADALPTVGVERRDRSTRAPMSQFYLGRAGNMIQLPSPALNYAADPSQGEAVNMNLSGGQVVIRTHPVKAKWTLNWTRLGGRDWQIVNGFYRRLFGAGPWFLVTPDETNRLTEAASTGASGWVASVGTAVLDGTVTAPVVPAGVVRWAGAGVNSLYVYGTAPAGVPTPDPLVGPPVVQSEPVTVSVYAKTATSTASVKLRVSGRQADGTLTAEWDSGAHALGTDGWTRLSTTIAPGDLGTAAFAVPVLVCSTASAPNLLVSAPQFEYADQASDWCVGSGSPRVTLAGVPRSVDDSLRSTVSMMLGQV